MISKYKIINLFIIAAFFIFISSCRTVEPIDESTQYRPKYIFLFIGDGMGQNHVALTQAVQSTAQGNVGFGAVFFTRFPFFADCTTWCANNQITDSGAAGSAIACGEKADYSVISYYPQSSPGSEPVSIAKTAHLKGMKVGIITTVSINHATPAAFYAVNQSRNNYYEIGLQLHESEFEFFGGGGFKSPTGTSNTQQDLYQIATQSGYIITNDLSTVSTTDTSVTGVYFVNPVLLADAEMPYCIDREESGGYALKDIVKEAIGFLDNEKGFFIMVEGGKIDWASHDNDAGTIVQEVVDFDNAIIEAYNFYMLHPDETLIIVTADHETGGVSLGNYSNDYDSNFSLLGMQKSSVTLFSELLDTYKQSTTNYDINHVYEMAASSFYTNPITYTHEDSIKISDAFDFYFLWQKNFSEKELYTKFGSSNAVAIAFSKILSDRAGVGFTTWSHTAAKVPVYTIGRKGPYFSGSLDNTDFNRKIVEIMGW